MPDRLAEIRARLDAYRDTYTRQFEKGADLWPLVDFEQEAPADIAWLLEEVERLTPEKNPVTKVGWIPNEHRTGP
jgi:hypothetical protein